MIDLDFLERLIKALDDSGIDSLEIERGGTKVRLAKTPPPGPVAVTGAQAPLPAVASGVAPETAEPATGATGAGPAPPAASIDLIEVPSPMVGTFYRQPAPDAPPYVDLGTRVVPGDTLCIIEAMKLMNELECEVSGTVVEICVENAQPIEFGQVLFRVEPS